LRRLYLKSLAYRSLGISQVMRNGVLGYWDFEPGQFSRTGVIATWRLLMLVAVRQRNMRVNPVT
jgi:hypothetical protein